MQRNLALSLSLGAVCLGFGIGLGYLLGRAEQAPEAAAANSTQPAATAASHPLAGLDPRASLLYMPYAAHVSSSARGTEAGREIAAWFDRGDERSLRRALAIYEEIIPTENWGGEYSALEWFCRYALASEQARARMLQDDDARRFVELFSPRDWEFLRTYLPGRYGLSRIQDPDTFTFIDELIRYNSPSRSAWERSDRVMELMDLQPGQAVADVGAGGGFFTYRFAQAVGSTGWVYAVEMNRQYLDYIQLVSSAEGLGSVVPVVSSGTELGAPPQSLDAVFLCAAYQTVYASVREQVRAALMKNIWLALEEGGQLVVVDNDPIDTTGNPFYGIGIAPELVIGQVEAYGFRLVHREHLTPQRYVLQFEKLPNSP